MIKKEDIELLLDMWKKYYGNIDLSLIPDKSLNYWISHYKDIKALVLKEDNEVIGYIR